MPTEPKRKQKRIEAEAYVNSDNKVRVRISIAGKADVFTLEEANSFLLEIQREINSAIRSKDEDE